ncbi:MAG: glycosyltransferase, partial [Hyphomicrobiaceae bacterium]
HMHAHFGSDATTAALLASRLTGIPFSFTAHARDIYHTYVDPQSDARMRRMKMAEARFVVTVSDHNKQYLSDLAGSENGRKIHRLYNGIDLARFSPDPKIKRETDLILSIGRLVEKKGLPDLLSACRILRDRGVGFSCVIVGDGPLRENLEQQIAADGLAGQVSLKGPMPQEDVIALMRRATMLAAPSVVAASGDRDGLPTVLLEALAAGLPAISTSVAGIPEIFGNEETGVLVAPSQPVELAAAMDVLLGDSALRERIATAARRRAKRLFSLSTNVATLKSFFIQVADQPLHRIHEVSDADRVCMQ